MKFLHTSDWHVGKALKGRNRLEEQKAVLAQIVDVAGDHGVDAVLVAGDLYENAVPTAEAVTLVNRTLRTLARQGIEVVAIAGNHDHPGTFEAYRPVMRDARIHVYGAFRTGTGGGVHRFTARSTGEQVAVAVLPFLSQRYAVRAAEAIANTPAQNVQTYDRMTRSLLGDLTAQFTPDSVNVIMAHLTCINGVFGGGERPAQSIFEYAVPASIFPADAHYVALGHLHRRQQLPAACPVHYSGSPLAVDFGEQDNTSVVCVVEASPHTPAVVTDVPITAGRRLRTVTGTVAELVGQARSFGDDYLRLRIREPARAGMREDLLEALPNALEIRIDEEFAAPLSTSRPTGDYPSRTPAQLFAEYCSEQHIDDGRVAALFDKLHDEVTQH